jgi:hypothetical protein
VLLTLVLALATFLGFSKSAETSEAKVALEKKVAFFEKLSDANNAQSFILKAYLGDYGPSVAEVQTQVDSLQRLATDGKLDQSQQKQIQDILASVQDIQEGYEKDMLGSVTAAEGAPAKEPTYREKLASLTAIVAKKNRELNIQVSQTQQAEADAKTKIASKQKEVEANQKAATDAQNELAKVKSDSLAKEEKLKNEVKGFTEQLRVEKDNFTKLQTAKDAQKRQLNKLVVDTEGENEKLKTKINRYEKEVYDRPDATIIKVADQLKMVFINIGAADGLTNNMTFAVYDESVTNFEKNKHKAMVEVTRVREFGADARITFEDPANPIVSGDHILTATWDPGFAVPIAIAGTFDLDGDRFDDFEKLVRMIERNGGKVVARHDTDGNITGKIDANVRYLVVGTSPSLGSDANPQIVQAIQDMEKEAEKNTVQIIGLQKLLSRMGVRARPKTIQYTERIRGFPRRSASDTLKSEGK